MTDLFAMLFLLNTRRIVIYDNCIVVVRVTLVKFPTTNPKCGLFFWWTVSNFFDEYYPNWAKIMALADS